MRAQFARRCPVIFTRLIGPIVHHPIVFEQRTDIHVGRERDKAIAQADAWSLAAFNLRVEIAHHAFENIDPRFGVILVGGVHRPGGIEHEHDVGVGKIERGLAVHRERHGGIAEQVHDRGGHRHGRHARDRKVLLNRHDETASGGAVATISEVVVEEPGSNGCAIGRDDPTYHHFRAKLLARRQHPGIAGLLQAGLREVGSPHVDPATNHRQQRHQRSANHRQRIA